MRATSRKEVLLKKGICQVMRILLQRGLITSLSGNVSARLPGSKEIWITPSKVFKGSLSSNNLVKIDLEGRVLRGRFSPSIEWPLHTAIYKVRPDINAVVHAHNPITIGLTLSNVKFKLLTMEAQMLLKKVPIIPPIRPGTRMLAKLVAEKIVDAKGIILQSHGVVGVGFDLTEAISIVEVIEENAKILLIKLVSESLQKLSL